MIVPYILKKNDYSAIIEWNILYMSSDCDKVVHYLCERAPSSSVQLSAIIFFTRYLLSSEMGNWWKSLKPLTSWLVGFVCVWVYNGGWLICLEYLICPGIIPRQRTQWEILENHTFPFFKKLVSWGSNRHN